MPSGVLYFNSLNLSTGWVCVCVGGGGGGGGGERGWRRVIRVLLVFHMQIEKNWVSNILFVEKGG